MRNNGEHRRGSAVMEFALLIPLLLIPLLTGMWDVSTMIDMNQILTRAAREGAVMASRGDDPVSAVKSYVETEGLVTDNLTVDVELGQPDPVLGQEVAVSLTYNFADATVYPWQELLPGGLRASARAKME
ncbi:MAG: TadE/TadG family type IV pilus assembly protein [Pseudodesulfovibrio sp.]|nr:TadE/TadG family type IV pilus assembly protein [Pseudodesulfovibrio indicus]